jgi:hypothetical protein
MIESIRDILLVVYLGLGIVLSVMVLLVTFFVQRTIFRMLRSAKHTLGNVEELTSVVLDKVGKPLATGSTAAFRVGSVLGFLSGFGRRRKRKRDKKDE